ncbi:FAS1-like dehydratase domain-containing protein [Neorhizobium alkalisoli]|uniref:3-methylfumaryl-CoA hydratase n=1 Tax=Neorhizobium alkalisoli TaxID=528178 RepID=A0A561R9B5_9HYPH|nr:MaoC family dehydratase N-terminal domain-containing protein [Neorhizobium alkalisoli]TWF59200.1 3-methylfumaryl-CoA hydratase [Neorhizobium alkalisoli]
MSENIQDWIGRSVEISDEIRPQPANFMLATLGHEDTLAPGDDLPPLWHFLYFLEAKPAGDLGRDGHPKKGGFLPPVSLPRRMWAGGRFTFGKPLKLGDKAVKRSSIQSISEKDGRSGKLCFVTVRYEVVVSGEVSIIEEQDIVYREDPAPDVPAPAPKLVDRIPAFAEEVTPTEVMLFRYSALTFNGHRIHYDGDYARTVEGYPGLVFHGPLTATLLAGLAERSAGRKLKEFSFRGQSPLAGMSPFKLEGIEAGDRMSLWARRHDGAEAMVADAGF